MTLRSAHGTARRYGAVAVIETPPIDEIAVGVPDPYPSVQPARDGLGRFRAGTPETVEAARAAGKARRSRTALAHTLGVRTDDPTWAVYLRQAEAFRRAQVRILAGTVGAGICGPAPAALVANAALALAASRYRYARGDMLEGARLAADVRQNLIGAHELAAREGQARFANEGNEIAQQQRDFQRRLAERALKPAPAVTSGDGYNSSVKESQ